MEGRNKTYTFSSVTPLMSTGSRPQSLDPRRGPSRDLTTRKKPTLGLGTQSQLETIHYCNLNYQGGDIVRCNILFL